MEQKLFLAEQSKLSIEPDKQKTHDHCILSGPLTGRHDSGNK